MAKMINVMAMNYQDYVSFCHKNGVKQTDARFIRDVTQMFGQWQGDIYVLHPVQTRRTTPILIEEATRRGLTVKYRDVSGAL